MDLFYGVALILLLAAVGIFTFLWFKESEEREEKKEQEILKIKSDITRLQNRNRELEYRQDRLERNLLKIFEEIDPMDKMYYEK